MGRRALRLVVALAALLLIGASVAQAELSQRGDLFVSFEGKLKPSALPRDHLAPISVSVGGRVRSLSGEEPPALRKIVIALNGAGKLDTRGLPACRRGEIANVSPGAALKACGDALVGEGRFTANADFPEQGSFPSSGHILAFNSRAGGETAIIAHVYGERPVPAARVVVFHVHRGKGAYGTVLSGYLTKAQNPHGYVKYISLNLFRTYEYKGRFHSYLSAACSAPKGLNLATFPFAKSSMTFADGRTLSTTITRSCRVKG